MSILLSWLVYPQLISVCCNTLVFSYQIKLICVHTHTHTHTHTYTPDTIYAFLPYFVFLCSNVFDQRNFSITRMCHLQCWGQLFKDTPSLIQTSEASLWHAQYLPRTLIPGSVNMALNSRFYYQFLAFTLRKEMDFGNDSVNDISWH